MNMTTDSNLLNLMTWLSPSFPVGGYVYSHGIEFAVEEGRVTDEHELCAWIKAALTQGAGRIDGALFKAAWLAVTEDDLVRVKWAVERADVMRGTAEMALESSAQGRAFLDTVLQTWKSEKLETVAKEIDAIDRDITYAIAVAVVSAAAEIPLRQALLAYYHAFSANLVSAGVRLVPLGQIAGQRSMEALKGVITDTAQNALEGRFDDLGAAAPLIDWASMKHETQYTRLFRS
jgi:urease accessory protein